MIPDSKGKKDKRPPSAKSNKSYILGKSKISSQSQINTNEKINAKPEIKEKKQIPEPIDLTEPIYISDDEENLRELKEKDRIIKDQKANMTK